MFFIKNKDLKSLKVFPLHAAVTLLDLVNGKTKSFGVVISYFPDRNRIPFYILLC